MLNLQPEHWSAIAAGVAAFIATASFVSQARSAARQARLALLERRLAVFDVTREAFSAGFGAAHKGYTRFVLGSQREGAEAEQLDEARRLEGIAFERLREGQARLKNASELAHWLFGLDVVRFIQRLDGLLRDIEEIYAWSFLLDRRTILSRAQQLEDLRSTLVATFEPYLGQERHFGLGWFHRLDLERIDRERKGDPLLQPSAPLNNPP